MHPDRPPDRSQPTHVTLLTPSRPCFLNKSASNTRGRRPQSHKGLHKCTQKGPHRDCNQPNQLIWHYWLPLDPFFKKKIIIISVQSIDESFFKAKPLMTHHFKVPPRPHLLWRTRCLSKWAAMPTMNYSCLYLSRYGRINFVVARRQGLIYTCPWNLQYILAIHLVHAVVLAQRTLNLGLSHAQHIVQGLPLGFVEHARWGTCTLGNSPPIQCHNASGQSVHKSAY